MLIQIIQIVIQIILILKIILYHTIQLPGRGDRGHRRPRGAEGPAAARFPPEIDKHYNNNR